MTFYKRMISYFLSGTIVKILPIIVVPILALYLRPEGMGKLSNFNVMASLFNGLIGMRLSKYVEIEYHKSCKAKQGMSPIITNVLGIQIVVLTTLLLLVFLFKNILQEILKIELGFLLFSGIVAFGTSVATIRSVMLRFSENVKGFVTFNILQSVLLAVLSIVFVVFLQLGWEGRAYSFIITSIIILIITFAFFIKNELILKSLDFTLIGKMLLFAVPLIPAALVPFIRNSIDKIFITNYIGLSENGIYSLMITISSIGFFVINVLFDTIIPDIYKMMSSGDFSSKDKEDTVKTLSKYIGIFIGFNIVGLLIFNLSYEFFIDERYYSGVKYMPLLLLHIVFQSIFILLNKFIFFSKKTKKLGLYYFSISAIHILLSLLLIKPFGVFGIIYSTLITDVVFLIVSYKLSQDYCNLPWNLIVKNIGFK